MKRKRKIRLNRKITLLIALLVLVTVGIATMIGYYVHGQKVDALFRERAEGVARTTTYFMDGDFASELYQAVQTEDFKALRERALAADDPELIAGWLRDKGFYEKYQVGTQNLREICSDMDVKWLYMQVQTAAASVNLLDPDEDIFYLSTLEANAKDFSDFIDNMHVDATVNYTKEFGYLCTAYEPVFDSTGKAVAVVGVDIDMNDIMRERHGFLITMVAFALVIALLGSLLGVVFMQRVVVAPLERLAKETDKFTSSEGGYTKEHIANLNINSGDEIQDLYEQIQSMELHIVDYIAHIEEITAEKERIGAELNVATQIQADMLPRIFPPFPGRDEFDLYATMDPAKEVGGDFYDFFLVDDDHLALVMADVSGKGVPAALFMVIAKTLIKNGAQMGRSPAEVLSYANDQLCEGNEAELFVTVWLGIIQISTGKGLAANAGHEHPALRRAGGKYELVVYKHSPAVATMEGLRFREHEFELHPGDSLYVYTDGVAEATNANNELYGPDRMVEALNVDPDSAPKEILRRVRESIDVFVGSAPQFDDITMLCLHWNG